MTPRMMKSLVNYHDLMRLVLVLCCLAGVGASSNSITLDDHCKDRRFVNSLNTTFMQFTKENVEQEYAVEGDFKSLHCCAKGYRTLEWFKDGKRYPWSQEVTSSLILYPEAANQTIYARKASKIDEGRYTCVLRNATHKMEHHIELKVKSNSPDIPLATFRPADQFANVDGAARFYCEAFIGKKVLPDIALSIRWYHSTEDASDDSSFRPVTSAADGGDNSENRSEEVVYREDEQIIGSYLKIARVSVNDYGRYLCRVEMGNSRKHRLEMSASLINALPIEARARSLLANPIVLGSAAALLALAAFFLLLRCVRPAWLTRLFGSSKEEEAMMMSASPLTAMHRRHEYRDDTRVMINRM